MFKLRVRGEMRVVNARGSQGSGIKGRITTADEDLQKAIEDELVSKGIMVCIYDESKAVKCDVNAEDKGDADEPASEAKSVKDVVSVHNIAEANDWAKTIKEDAPHFTKSKNATEWAAQQGYELKFVK